MMMIVMEFVAQTPPGSSRDEAHLALKPALDILHNRQLVFGDLRQPNILVPVNRSGKQKAVMLIDFDWCGEDGKDCYPWDINISNINWPSGVGPGALMYCRHDLVMLGHLVS
ncbi:hypothetical protein CTheo_4894 [Ceratobasidium theobromae]|uniref:Protein kinase domain-containing protein n=1 Tax=Ceratobasidium theobromae TaxID=1582974 RepID=A0A5N5QIS0_9AGAM|nr:hypothetical protein CTheo_4894 [Ceratobasidium theobromae]